MAETHDLRTVEGLTAVLREAFPHGHPDFIPMLIQQMQLHSDKNHDYAKGGRPLGNFERVGQILANYPGLPIERPEVIALLYALKQVDAVLWGLAQNIEHKVEGLEGRLRDILIYAGIAICALRDRPITATEIKDRWIAPHKPGQPTVHIEGPKMPAKLPDMRPPWWDWD